MSWKETSENHWIWKMDENQYRVIIIEWSNEHSTYVVKNGFVNVLKLAPEEIEDALSIYEISLEELKRKESDWKQIVAEEYIRNKESILSADHYEVVALYIKNRYGLVSTC